MVYMTGNQGNEAIRRPEAASSTKFVGGAGHWAWRGAKKPKNKK